MLQRELLRAQVQRLSNTADEDPPLGAEADYLLFPLNRQQPFKHWVLAVLDLRTKQFTLLDSLAKTSVLF